MQVSLLLQLQLRQQKKMLIAFSFGSCSLLLLLLFAHSNCRLLCFLNNNNNNTETAKCDAIFNFRPSNEMRFFCNFICVAHAAQMAAAAAKVNKTIGSASEHSVFWFVCAFCVCVHFSLANKASFFRSLNTKQKSKWEAKNTHTQTDRDRELTPGQSFNSSASRFVESINKCARSSIASTWPA